MRLDKQKHDKRKFSFVIFTGCFALFLILSFFSVENVYAIDNEVISKNNIINDYNLISNFPNNIANNHRLTNNPSPISTNSTNNSIINNNNHPFNFDSKTNNDSNRIGYNKDSFENFAGKSTIANELININFMDYNLLDLYFEDSYFADFYFIFFNDSTQRFFNDINDFLNHFIVLVISSLNFKGNGFESLNNFIKKIINIDFNKFDNNEDFLILDDYQSSSYQTLTILFFMKIFMDFHKHGKERLNSF